MAAQGARAKTWGPFTGRQLTTMICVLAVMLLLPVTSWAAVSFTNVAITDPGGVNRAKVDATGALNVGGSVAARTGLPSKPIVVQVTHTLAPGGTPVTVYGPVSKAFGITSITIDNYDSLSSCKSITDVGIYSKITGGGIYLISNTSVPVNETVHLDFPTPLVTTPPAGGTVSLVIAPLTGCAVFVSAVGIQS